MLTDSPERYGLVSIALHWLAAALVIYLFLDGNRLEDAPDAAIRASHIAAGALGALLLVPRVVWRLVSGSPRPLSGGRLLNGLASLVKMLLLLDILAVVASGLLVVWSTGGPVEVPGLVSLPSPIGRSPDLHHLLEGLHSLAAHLFIPLTGLHVLGALKHLVWDRDGTLGRMLWPAGRA